MTHKKLQSELEKRAQIFSLFSDPNRLRIILFLTENKRANVSEIASTIGMSVACTSHHLQLLKDNQVLTRKRQGNNIYYSLMTDPFIQNLLHLLTQ